MNLKEKVRHYYHDSYYALTGKRGAKFAMRCKDVVGHIDLENESQGLLLRLRLFFHLSLCKACADYAAMSKALRRAIRDLVKSEDNPDRLKKLNQLLLDRHAAKKPSL